MLIDQLNNKYTPELAFMIYKSENHTGQGNEHYLESHQVLQKSDGSFALGAGAPVSEETLKSLANYFSNQEAKTIKYFCFKERIIPNHILNVTQRGESIKITWFVLKPKRTLLFHEALNIPNGEIELPNLVFQYNNGSLSVAAFLDDQPKLSTPLFHAPFHNTSNTGVCMGNVSIPNTTAYWEDLCSNADNAFFNSYFTHLNGNNPVIGNLNLIYEKAISKGLPFPSDQLIQSSNTIKDLL